MKCIKDIPHVIGMYVTDSNELYNTANLRVHLDDKHKGYIPLFDLININHTSEFILSDTVSKGKEIVSYDRATSGKSLSDAIVRSKRIDITHNDLFMGDINVVLNFTNKNITVNDGTGFVKTFTRLKQDKLEDFSGNVVIFTLKTFNTPSLIKDTIGVSDYMTPIIDKLERRNNPMSNRTANCYRFARDNWHRFNKVVNGHTANSIKVIEMFIIHESEFINDDVFLDNYRFIISNKTILEMQDNPAMRANDVGVTELMSIFPDNCFMCYIVDNDDRLGERYINVAGHVKRIDKIKNRTIPNGLYFTEKGKDNLDSEIFCKLEDIDDSGYVYRSVEEANEGADMRKKYTDEIETYRVENTRLKNEHEREISKIKLESERRAAEFDIERGNLERELVSRKHNHEVSRFDMDNRSMRNKYNYETERYQRDTTIETLKTFAAGLGVASTVFVLANKFIK